MKKPYLTLNQIHKRNEETMVRILPELKQKYQIKHADSYTILLKLDSKDDVEIFMHNTVKPLFYVYVWKHEVSATDFVQKVSEDRLIPLVDELIKLYNLNYRFQPTKKDNNAWYGGQP